ncbi:MAG: BCD family MFS transporter [Propioniciclava sp.]
MRAAVHVARLGLLPVAYGLSGALIGGTLNRVMIVEMGYPATVVAVLFALPLMISPVRVWLGHTSDTRPLGGLRRVPYVLLGAGGIAVGAVAITVLAVSPFPRQAALLAGLAVAFVLYGVGRNLGLTSFQALVAERFAAHMRGRAITLYEVATLLGLVLGAGFIGQALATFDARRTVMVAVGVAVAVFVLAAAAVHGQESRRDPRPDEAEAARIPFRVVLTDYVLADPQIRRFFAVVFCTFIGTLAQDVLLEPFGGLVLGLSVGETTRLTMFWGLGVMAAMLLSGLFLLRRVHQVRLMRIGIVASIGVFLALIGIGAAGAAHLIAPVVAGMGLATGIAGAGMLASVIGFTTRLRAGLLMGVWGVANMAGHAIGSVMGGFVVDLGTVLTGSSLLAYSAVFALEIGFLVAALAGTRGLRIAAARVSSEDRAFGAAGSDVSEN